ncbi:MAG: tetratricopeptide repeat protein [Bryobacteraceae bacterium]
MFCHNAYPRISAGSGKPFAEAVYEGALPEGIDCERCHGGGARHVELAGRAGAARDAVRRSIVNPARLSADRQMEICMGCHLETTSFPLPNAVQRYDRGPFSYRPGEPLGDFLLNFDHAPSAGREDKFEIVSAAYRLRKSACFLESNGKMLCTTCHDPHAPSRGAEAERQYAAACRQCHSQPLSAASHTGSGGCAECHMPKRRTEDVIHAVVTDHYIQRRKPPGDLLAERSERQDIYRGEVVLYYPASLAETADNELYQAVAQVKQKSNVKEGVARLERAIAKYAPKRAEWRLELAEGFEHEGQWGKAADSYREAARLDPASAIAWQKLGTALRRSGRTEEAVAALRRSIAVDAGRALTWHELGLTYRSLDRPAEALDAMGKAIERDPELPEAHNNAGILRLAAGDATRAEAAFREAIRIKTSYADAHGNLANLLAAGGRTGEAQQEFTRALRLTPADAGTRYNYALLLGRLRRYDEAQQQLEACLRDDPAFVDASALLGDLLLARNQPREAAIRYREVLRQQPDAAKANLGLGLALAAAGDRDGAIVVLRRAASGPDAAIAQRAMELLRQLGADVAR